MEKKRKFVSATSPIGTFKYPKLSEPDFGNDKYPKPDGVYATKLVLDGSSPEAKAFVALLKPHYEAALAEAEEAFSKLKIETRKKLKAVSPNNFFTEVYDKDTEQPTGEIEFNFSMPASGTYKKGPKEGQKWTAKPHVFDAKGTRLVKVPSIWGGTTGRLSFEMRPYFIGGTGAAGLSLRLVGVQVIDLVSGGAKSAKDLGFGAVEGGYEQPEESNEQQLDLPLDEGTSEGLGDTTNGDF